MAMIRSACGKNNRSTFGGRCEITSNVEDEFTVCLRRRCGPQKVAPPDGAEAHWQEMQSVTFTRILIHLDAMARESEALEGT